MMQEQQQPIVVEVEGIGELEFPAGTQESVIDGAVQEALRESRTERIRQNVLNAPEIRGAAQGMMLPMGGQATALAGPIKAIGSAISKRAVPMVRSALKPVWQQVRKRANVEGQMPAAVANSQARFIVDKQLRTPEQADSLVKSLGRQTDDVVAGAEKANPELAIDSSKRIPRYLNTLLQRVEKQVLPGQDRAAIQNVGRELVNDSPLSRSTYQAPAAETLEQGLTRGVNEARAIARNAPVEGITKRRPALINPNLKALEGQLPRTGVMRDVTPESELAELLKRADANVNPRAGMSAGPGPRPVNADQFTGRGGAFPQSSRPRELRSDVRPSEALELVRNKSFFNKDATGGQIAGGKAIERAVRDGVKQAVPATKPILSEQGRAIDARTLLDRANWRDANRDQIGMGGLLGVAGGRPLIGLLLQAVKENQLRAGLAAGRVGPRITRSAQNTGDELQRSIAALIAAIQSPTEPRE